MSVRGAERFVRDVSDYQSQVSPEQVRRAGSRALMIKACQDTGTGQAEGAELYAYRADRAHAHNLQVLHYAYLGASPGIRQAEVLLDAVEKHFHPGDRLVADIEITFAGGAGTACMILEGWRDELRRHGHTMPIGYTDRAYPYLRAIAPILPAGWLIADYGTLRRPNLLDFLAVRGSILLGRQFTDGQHGAQPHTCPGITGPVDCSWLTRAGVKGILKS
jgi:GH25 family lysozyme M1 (1,4-beta-N-acetylmuramidase)